MADNKTDVILQIKVDDKSIKQAKKQIQDAKKEIEKNDSYAVQLGMSKALEQQEKRRREIAVTQEKNIAKAIKERESVLKEEQKIRYAISREQEKQAKLEKNTQIELDKNIAKLKIFKDQMSRSINTLTTEKYGSSVDTPSLNQLKYNISNLSATTPDLSIKMKELENQFKNIKTSAVLASQGTNTFTKDLVHNSLKMTEWAIAGGVLFGTLNKIGDSIKFITDLDTAFANIRMASGMTRDETAGLASQYNELARSLGVSTEVIASSAVELYRQGLSTQEASAQLQDYIKFSKVLGRDLQSTIELGTAGTTTYGVSVQRLGDISTAVGDAVASSGDEVLQIIQKSGSSAQVAGVQLEELATIGALVASSTRESGLQIGTSLKNIFSKLSQVDDLTGEINDDYGKTLKRIASLGIAIEDGNGNLLDAMDILKNVGNSWDKLSEQQQKYLASGFGVYQLNRFSAAIKAISDTTGGYNDLIKVAYGSTGALNTKYEEYSNSIEASNQRLKASWEDLYINVIDSGMIQSTINLGTVFIDLINKTNAVQMVMVALGVVLTANLIKGFASLIPVIISASAYLKAFGLEAVVLTGATGIGGLAIGLGILVGGLIAVSKHMEEAERANIDLANSLTASNNQATSLISSIADLNDVQNLNEEQQLRLQQTYDELVKIYPELENLVDRNTLSYDSLAEATLKASDAQKQLAIEALKAQKASLTSLLASEKAMQEKRKTSATTSKPIPGFAGFSQADLIPVADANIAKIEKQLKEIEKAEAELNKSAITKTTFEPTIKKTSGTGVTYTPLDEKKSKTPDILDNFRKQITLIDELSSSLNILKSKADLVEGDDKIKAQNKIIDGYKHQQKAVSAYSDAIRNYIKTNKVSQEDLDKLNAILRSNGEQWFSLQVAIKGVKDEQEAYNKKTLEDTKKAIEETIKITQDLLKDLSDALEKQDEEQTKIRIQGMKDRLELVDKEIQELEDKYKKAEDNIDRNELLDKIALLNKEKAMRAIEGSLDASARIYEIDEELVGLNKQLAEKDRKTQYENDKKILENKKDLINDEINKEERALEERKRNQIYFQQARVMLEKNALSDIMSVLSSYNSAFALDGATKGQMWLDEFKSKVAQASQYLISTPNVSTSNSGTSSSSNQQAYLENLAQTGTSGQKIWAEAQLSQSTKSNQQKYLENLASTGTSGQKKWAESQLQMGKYHNGVENGLVGGLPIPKNFEQIAMLAKGEMVLNQPQLKNLSSFINGAIPKMQSVDGANIVNNFNISATLTNDYDTEQLTKTMARNMEKQSLRRGVRV